MTFKYKVKLHDMKYIKENFINRSDEGLWECPKTGMCVTEDMQDYMGTIVDIYDDHNNFGPKVLKFKINVDKWTSTRSCNTNLFDIEWMKEKCPEHLL